MWQDQVFERSWFLGAIDDLKAAQPKKLTHNFVTTCATPGNVSWSDDAGWDAVAKNLATLAWVAKEGGLKGVALDPESYRYQQFAFSPEIGPTFEETAAIARKRGHQVMSAMAKEYPDMTLLAYWFYSLVSREAESGSPLTTLPRAQYGLAAAFFTGMLEAMPSTMTIVDGLEHAYHYNGLPDFQNAYALVKGANSPITSLIPPELREKYEKQVQVGFGIYLDAYVSDRSSVFHVGGVGDAPRIEGLKKNVTSALAVADQYVWTWGEQSRWWDRMREDEWTQAKVRERAGQGRHWNDAFPGMTQAILDARRDAAELKLDAIAYTKPGGSASMTPISGNLVRNPRFRETGKRPAGNAEGDPKDWFYTDTLPAHFSGWQKKGSQGTLDTDTTLGFDDRSSARAQNVKEGCFIQKVDVIPGGVYRVSARARVEGNGTPLIQTLWRNKHAKGMVKSPFNRMIPFNNTSEPKEDGWLHADDVIRIPEGVTTLILCMGVSHQRSFDDKIWFDNIEVTQLKDR